VWNLEEQLKLFDSSKGMKPAGKWQYLIGEFFTAQGRFNQRISPKVKIPRM